jgi:hypothetical protein
MRRMCLSKPTPLIAGLLTGLLFAILAVPLSASPTETNPQHPVLGYDRAHEITLTGTIEQALTTAPKGSPAGLHLMVTGSEGTVDTHLGPYMSKETLEALHTGTPVQIIGAMERAHGKNYLLAREVMVGGRTITVRNDRGLLVRVQAEHTTHHAKNAKIAREFKDGGAR